MRVEKLGTSLNDAYDTLGATEESTFKGIHTMYLRLMAQHHPDRDPEVGATERTQTINSAWQTIQALYNGQEQPSASEHVGTVDGWSCRVLRRELGNEVQYTIQLPIGYLEEHPDGALESVEGVDGLENYALQSATIEVVSQSDEVLFVSRYLWSLSEHYQRYTHQERIEPIISRLDTIENSFGCSPLGTLPDRDYILELIHSVRCEAELYVQGWHASEHFDQAIQNLRAVEQAMSRLIDPR